jgi:hypothetical protein
MRHLYSELQVQPFLLITHKPFYYSTLGTLSNCQRLSINDVSVCRSNCRSYCIKLLCVVSSSPTMLRVQPLSAPVHLTTRKPDAAEFCICDVCLAYRRLVWQVAKCIDMSRGNRHGRWTVLRFLVCCWFYLNRLPVYVQTGQTASCFSGLCVCGYVCVCVCVCVVITVC